MQENGDYHALMSTCGYSGACKASWILGNSICMRKALLILFNDLVIAFSRLRTGLQYAKILGLRGQR